MAEALTAAAGLVLTIVAIGLARLLRGPSAADRMMAVQLLGTGGAAVALLLAVATATPAIVDVALTLAVLAAFAAAALGAGTSREAGR
ncbi:monovalent cation/H+ antiporter complex subunit F [Ancylobacter terrae]|uniref:monovalent cation/H+ antiporter complex subunit F n=1 Tax=Ancylobacter sp. sgz301288 TaxID=3342077 RepID=UPI00385DEF22